MILPKGRKVNKIYGVNFSGKKNHNKTKGNMFEKYVLNHLLLSGIPARRVRANDILLLRTNERIECKYISSAYRAKSGKSSRIQWYSLHSLIRADYTVIGMAFMNDIVVITKEALVNEVFSNHNFTKTKVVLSWPVIFALKPVKFSEFIKFQQEKHGVMTDAKTTTSISDKMDN